jgi:hypothetical protein
LPTLLLCMLHYGRISPMIFTLSMRPHGACEEYEDDDEEVDDVEDIRKDWKWGGPDQDEVIADSQQV